MGAPHQESFFSRVAPGVSLLLGLACIPLGFLIRGAVGGALIGGGIVFILSGISKFIRLRYIGWRRLRAFREEESEKEGWMQLGMNRLEEEWDNPQDAIYDDWKKLHDQENKSNSRFK